MSALAAHRFSSHIGYALKALLGGHPLSRAERKARHYTPLSERAYPGSEHFVELSAGRICYIEKGQGPTVLLLHGLAAHIGRWAATIEELARDFHVIAYDHPGYGKSEKRGDVYTIADLAQTLDEFLQVLDLKEVSLIGHSMGGTIALHHLLAQPKRIARAAVVAPAGIRPAHHWLGQLLVKAFLKMGIARFVMPRMIAGCVVQKTPAVQDMIFHSSHATEDPEWPKLRDIAIKTAQHFLHYSLLNRLAEIHVPLLIVWGEHDKLQSANLALAIHNKIPMARLALIPGCGHYPMLEVPDRFHAILHEFLTDQIYIEGCEH